MNKLVEKALKEYGVSEIIGEENNDRIMQYFADIGQTWVTNDETAWCSAFMNWVALQAGYERSNKLNARSWLEVGEEVKTPQVGDIVVFWRQSPESWKGHVGIFISKINGGVMTLGGNQNNSVCIKPYTEDRVLSYRRLDKAKD